MQILSILSEYHFILVFPKTMLVTGSWFHEFVARMCRNPPLPYKFGTWKKSRLYNVGKFDLIKWFRCCWFYNSKNQNRKKNWSLFVACHAFFFIAVDRQQLVVVLFVVTTNSKLYNIHTSMFINFYFYFGLQERIQCGPSLGFSERVSCLSLLFVLDLFTTYFLILI